MKKSIMALALAFALLGTLAACGTDRRMNGNNAGTNSSNTGTSGANGSNNGSSAAGSGMNGAAGSVNGTTGSGATTGQVARRYDTGTAYNGTTYNGRTYWNDGRYAAGSNGRVYDTTGGDLSRDLTRDARDMVRDTGDAIGDIGRGIGNAARDITGMGNTVPSGTPSWEADSSAVRY